MNIMLLGPSASGKGTQAELLVKEYGLTHIVPGAEYRKHIANNTEIGKLVAPYVNNGIYVPNEITNKMMVELIAKAANSKGMIFDGYPRNAGQADFLDENVKLDLVIYLDVPFNEVNKRLSERTECRICKTPFGGSKGTPKRCTECGNELVKRIDDSDTEANKRRYEQYLELVAPLAERYKKIMFKFLATGTHLEVWAKVKAFIDKKGFKR